MSGTARPSVRPKAILFDYDGVIADTMTDNFTFWQEVFRRRGVEINGEEFFLLEGMGGREIAGRLCLNHGIDPGSALALAEEKESLYATRNRFSLFPAVPQILETLARRGIRLGLVSGASKGRLEKTLPASLRALFGSVITADDIARTKPFPDPYLAGARELNARADACIAVENAILGIASARAAGMFCIALCTTMPAERLAEANVVLSGHDALLEYLMSLTEP